MSSAAKKRLMRDYKQLQEEPPEGISGAPHSDNLMRWNAVIFGPEGTAWEGGIFRLLLEFTEEYPQKPPEVKFLSPMFHPNVYTDGKICLDILQNRWSAAYGISGILTSIRARPLSPFHLRFLTAFCWFQSLLPEPNPDSPANAEAAKVFQENKNLYFQSVASVVEKSWEDQQ